MAYQKDGHDNDLPFRGFEVHRWIFLFVLLLKLKRVHSVSSFDIYNDLIARE